MSLLENPISRGLNEAVAAYVRQTHDALIGLGTAEQLANAAKNSRALEVAIDATPAAGGATRGATVDLRRLNQFIHQQLLLLPLTPTSMAVVEAARAAAIRLHHGYVGQEHLVLALLDAPEAVAAVRKCGVDYTSVVASVDPYLQVVADDAKPEPSWTARAARAVWLAVQRAQREDRPATPADLVVGLIEDGEGLGASAFTAAGISLAKATQGT
jgi:hypothetical protein